MAQAVMAAAAVAGAGYSIYSGEQQQRSHESSMKKERQRQAGLATEERDRYYAELKRGTEHEARAYASAQQDWEAYTQTSARQYESDVQEYEEQVADLEDWKAHWTSIAEDPASGHPGWPSFETAITEAAQSQTEMLEDLYQRRGKAGSGEYMRAISEIEGTRQKSLQDALMGITREARGKMYEIDSAMPTKPRMPMPMQTPVLGGAQNTGMGMGQLGVGQGYIPGLTSAVGDIQGLGQGLAYALDRYTADEKKTAPTSTIASLSEGVPASQQWTIPGAEGIYEGAFGEELAPQQTEYQLLQ